MFHKYWRLPSIALVGALVAFASSYAVSPVYASSTQLLVRGRDATFLTSTGKTLADQPGVVDASLARALGETQGALLGSRGVATLVVKRLHLDRPVPPDRSLVGRAKSLVSGATGRLKAYLVHGGYAEANPFERAVAEVHDGLSARQLRDSYVLELVASGRTPALAVAIADASADALISVSRDRFRADAAKYRDVLAGQVARAEEVERVASESLRAFKAEHSIANVDLEIDLNVETANSIRTQLRDAQVAAGAAKAELGAINASLAGVAPTRSSESSVQTGRSTTRIETAGASTLFDQLRVAKALAESKLAAEQAKVARLSQTLDPEGAPSLNGPQADLRRLDLQYDLAVASLKALNERYEQAVANSEADVIEITRVDAPSKPTYPVSPKRYLYIGLGGILGALAGLVLTARVARRRGEPLFPWIAEEASRWTSGPAATNGNGAHAVATRVPAHSRSMEAPLPLPAQDPLDLTTEAVAGGGGRFEIFEPSPQAAAGTHTGQVTNGDRSSGPPGASGRKEAHT